MHIRKQLLYDGHAKRTTGYVDIGIGQEEESEELATEALVFMLVGLNSHWKSPVGYYLTKGLTSDTQTELLQHCLESLTTLGFQVHCITMDGHATNIAMCKNLGASLNVAAGLKPYFTLPNCNFKTFIMLDPCHMVKLARNTLQTYHVIRSPKGFIQWNYIKDLNSLQDDVGLRLANRLSAQHIDFQNQKMKVILNAQVIFCNIIKQRLKLAGASGIKPQKFQGPVGFLILPNL